ncbi:MAG: hypothetical protein HYV09_11240 [Deltaproteobacteria bacterium]|nr:hypothetical protein [Deltaproteobacteria bacterium]
MTRSRQLLAVTGVAVAIMSLGGCERRREPVAIEPAPQPPPTAIGGGPLDTEAAVERIVEARCVREASCGLIGTKWASHEACVEVASREYADDLTEEDCPNGVDGNGLSQCEEATRTADCNLALDVVGRVPACRKSTLCSR